MSKVLAKTKPLEIDGFTFLLQRNWGLLKWAQKELKQVRVGDEGDPDEQAAEAIDRILLRIVTGWQDVTDENGTPLTWGQEALDDLDPDTVNHLLQAIMGMGEGRGGELTTSSEPGTPSGEATS